MTIIFITLACVSTTIIFLLLSMLESRSERGTAFRLLRKMIVPVNTHSGRDDQPFVPLMARQLRAKMPWLDERALRPLLHDAGLYTERHADTSFLAWITLVCCGVLLAFGLPGPTSLWCFLFGALGLLGPYVYLRLRASRRRTSIARGLPDVIDLLVICVEAGLGLDQALQRVLVEFAETHPDLHIEFSRLLQHQGAGMPRSEAWRCMAERVRVPEIDAFASMVAQTERFGTPIARALAELSALSRQKRTQAAEQAAAKTTVKISFPLVLFIFPCIFIVLLGPALITMSRSLAGIFR